MFTAIFAYRRRLLLKDASALGYGEPTEDELFFWTYYYFQQPYGAKNALRKNGSWEINNFEFDLTSQDPKDIPSKAYQRLLTWKLIQTSMNWK